MFICLMAATLAAHGITDGGRVLVVNQGSKDLSVVSAASRSQIATIDEKQTTMHGHEVAASPDGRFAYVPIYGSSGVGSPGLDGREMLVVDLRTGEIVHRVDFGRGVRPHCVIFEPVRKLLYVTTELEDTVTVVDPKSLKIVGSIPTGEAESHMLAISADGKRGYTANVSSGTVSVLDLISRKTVAVVKVASGVQRVAVSTDGFYAFTSDVARPRMAVIDTRSLTVARWIDLPGTGYGSAATPDGRELWVPIPGKNLVAIVDLGTFQVKATVPVVAAPQEVLIQPDDKFAYVAGSSAHQLAVLDVHDHKMVATVEVGSFPDGLAWAP